MNRDNDYDQGNYQPRTNPVPLRNTVLIDSRNNLSDFKKTVRKRTLDWAMRNNYRIGTTPDEANVVEVINKKRQKVFNRTFLSSVLLYTYFTSDFKTPRYSYPLNHIVRSFLGKFQLVSIPRRAIGLRLAFGLGLFVGTSHLVSNSASDLELDLLPKLNSPFGKVYRKSIVEVDPSNGRRFIPDEYQNEDYTYIALPNRNDNNKLPNETKRILEKRLIEEKRPSSRDDDESYENEDDYQYNEKRNRGYGRILNTSANRTGSLREKDEPANDDYFYPQSTNEAQSEYIDENELMSEDNSFNSVPPIRETLHSSYGGSSMDRNDELEKRRQMQERRRGRRDYDYENRRRNEENNESKDDF